MKCLEEGKHCFSWQLLLFLSKWLRLKESTKGSGDIQIKNILQVCAGFSTLTI